MLLFEAPVDHVGYVAANLAVRWHPDGKAIDFVKEAEPHRHGLFAFDLATKAVKQSFPHAADALAFDRTPDGSRRYCVLGTDRLKLPNDGLWVEDPASGGWWQVPDSAHWGPDVRPPALEHVRGLLPNWTPDGKRFALVSFQPTGDGKGGTYALRIGDPAGRRVEEWLSGPELLRDVRWHPSGDFLGFVRGGSLCRIGHDRKPTPVTDRAVTAFAGWDATGQQLAYVAADPLPLRGEPWAFLFVAQSAARQSVWVADGKGADPGRVLVSGLRATFLHWSPKEAKLSLWLTFEPPYRSWAVAGPGRGLRAGDPAALLDAKTGQVEWLSVSATEQAQIGHYHLLKREDAGANRHYVEAEKGIPEAGRAGLALFRSVCLTRLGKDMEARAAREQFERDFRPEVSDAFGLWSVASPAAGALVGGQGTVAAFSEGGTFRLGRDLYVAEVFLSLDAADEGVAYFREALQRAPSDEARLSCAIVLAQLLLLQEKHADYAEVLTAEVLPRALKVCGAPPEPWQNPLVRSAGLTLLPLASADFVKQLPEGTARGLLPRWQRLRADAGNDLAKLGVDLTLAALAERAGDQAARKEAADRLERNPACARMLPEGVDKTIEQIRAARKLFDGDLGENLAGMMK